MARINAVIGPCPLDQLATAPNTAIKPHKPTARPINVKTTPLE